jgi:hypothetical protein
MKKVNCVFWFFPPLFFFGKPKQQSTTMAPIDPCKVVCCLVTAKTKHVLYGGECGRCDGSLWKSKQLEGIVIDVKLEKNEGGTDRKTTYIVASYNPGNKSKTKKLVITLESDNTSVATQEANNNNNTQLLDMTTEEATTLLVDTVAIGASSPTTMAPTITTTPEPTIPSPTTISTPTLTPRCINTPPSVSNTQQKPTVTAHHEKWFTNDTAVTADVNGLITTPLWGVKTDLDDV